MSLHDAGANDNPGDGGPSSNPGHDTGHAGGRATPASGGGPPGLPPADRPYLHPEHLADLRKSGLSDTQILACRFRTIRDAKHIAGLLKWSRPANRLGMCLAIPFFGRDGTFANYVRLRPSCPLADKNSGKPRKYESPKGVPNRAYIPPGTRAALADPAAPLLMTEGEKKAAKADQEGFPCLGLVGVYGWMRKRKKDGDGRPVGPPELIDDLAGVAWKGRRVCLAYDSDLADNQNVLRAERMLAAALVGAGAEVRVLRLPPGPAGEKVGLDDFLVAHGPDDLRALIAAAGPPDGPPPGGSGGGTDVLREHHDDPHRLARSFLSLHEAGGVRTLHYYRDEMYRWAESAYRAIPTNELRAEVNRHVRLDFEQVYAAQLREYESGGRESPPTMSKVRSGLVNDVQRALEGCCCVPAARSMPFWHGAPRAWVEHPPCEVLACRNGLLHLPTLVSGGDSPFAPPDPSFFTANALEYDYAPDAPRPDQWLKFLASVWPDDPQSIETLQRWFGYCLLPDTSQQKILLMVGPRRSGKGTVARVLRLLIGAGNVAGPTLGSLATNFGLQPLLDKTLAIVPDARLSSRTDTATVTERLLQISGEDAVTVDRKYLPPITLKLSARFMLLTNELPRLNDSSAALSGRFVTLQMRHSFYGREDHGLTDRLLGELPGILLWAVEGWRRLRERGRFDLPDSARALAEEMEDLASPVGAFVRECCQIGPGHEVAVHDLFARWVGWCESVHREPGNQFTFGRDLRACQPGVEVCQHRRDVGRQRYYSGITLLP